jgi:hypothetical protein
MPRVDREDARSAQHQALTASAADDLATERRRCLDGLSVAEDVLAGLAGGAWPNTLLEALDGVSGDVDHQSFLACGYSQRFVLPRTHGFSPSRHFQQLWL